MENKEEEWLLLKAPNRVSNTTALFGTLGTLANSLTVKGW